MKPHPPIPPKLNTEQSEMSTSASPSSLSSSPAVPFATTAPFAQKFPAAILSRSNTAAETAAPSAAPAAKSTYFTIPLSTFQSPEMLAREKALDAEGERIMADLHEKIAEGVEELSDAELERVEAYKHKAREIARQRHEIQTREELRRMDGYKPKTADQLSKHADMPPEIKRWMNSRQSQSGGGKYSTMPQTAEELKTVPPNEVARLREVLRKRQEKRAAAEQQQAKGKKQ